MPIVRDIQFPALPIDLAEFLATIEEAYIDEALRQAADSKKEAAVLLGLNRTTLVEKLRRAGATRLKRRA